MACGTNTGLPVLATCPTIPSPASKISEFNTFSMKRARGEVFSSELVLMARCGGKSPSTATPFNLPLGSFS